ncbi:DUF4391 domain-containing protein [Clostridium beijerinckii]|uniref:DUF4391 domain-containing protein n=1 Tax=Clostridium beijerinckii TaxID=1520 RepID=A0A1S8S3B8_CLOBE|nr:DUF4391 domain-containing protein [Clostridium beijerinckii]NRY63837.1 hypothetical protein [Clostridium beijerinckii]OOM59755.1 hypothetical protein CLBCK_33010 [Clostridium beijerinckii]
MGFFEEYLVLPKSCIINARMPKKAFTDNPEFDLRKEEKSIIKEYIENIYLQYSLKPQLINIPKYEDEYIRYEEIEIIKIKITEQGKENKICDLIQKYIQYPMLIIIEFNELVKINAAIKKINKVEREKLSIEEMIYTDWINLNELTKKEKDFLRTLSINNVKTNNLFTVYEDFTNNVNSFNISKYKDVFEVKSVEDTINDIELLEKIKTIESEITTLRNNIKKESNIGAKVELNVKIKELQKKIEEIKNRLN